ncbi:MAGa5490 family lipoprotein, partial [Mycoplasmopsis bovis]
MKQTRFLLLSIASIAPLITISSIGCFVSDKEYKQYLKNLKVIDDFEITRPVIKDSKWDEYNRSYNAFKTWLKSRREKAPRNPYANQAFATMNLFLTNA